MKNSFKDLKLEEMLIKRDELRKKYFDLRFQMVVGMSRIQLKSEISAVKLRGLKRE